MTLVWGVPLIPGGAIVTAELANLAVDQCELVEERFTLMAPDNYRADFLEVKLWDKRGDELAAESLYVDDEDDEERHDGERRRRRDCRLRLSASGSLSRDLLIGQREVAGAGTDRALGLERRLVLGAQRLRLRAAGVEAASRRRVGRARHVAGQQLALALAHRSDPAPGPPTAARRCTDGAGRL